MKFVQIIITVIDSFVCLFVGWGVFGLSSRFVSFCGGDTHLVIVVIVVVVVVVVVDVLIKRNRWIR